MDNMRLSIFWEMASSARDLNEYIQQVRRTYGKEVIPEALQVFDRVHRKDSPDEKRKTADGDLYVSSLDKLSMLREVCSRYKGCASEYFVEPIPERKVINARASLGISPSDQIVALIDFTIFGSATEAMVVTERGLCWKNKEDASPRSLSWGQLRQRTHSETNTLLSKIIEFGDGLKMDLQGAATLITNANHAAFQLISDLKAMAEGVVPNAQTSVTSDGLDSGLIECEFCKNKIKPEVTYCKHCGIKLRG